MRVRVAIVAAAVGVLVMAVAHAQSLKSGLDVAGFDRTVLPQDRKPAVPRARRARKDLVKMNVLAGD